MKAFLVSTLALSMLLSLMASIYVSAIPQPHLNGGTGLGLALLSLTFGGAAILVTVE